MTSLNTNRASKDVTFVEVPYERRRRSNVVTISKRGHIGLPHQLMRSWQVAKPPQARLYWDSAARAVLIALVSNGPTAFPVHDVAASGGAVINASSFFRACNVQSEEVAARYPYEVKLAQDVGIHNLAKGYKVCLVLLGGRKQPLRSPGTNGGDGPATIRAWAKAQGYTVSSKGPLPQHVRKAYTAMKDDAPSANIGDKVRGESGSKGQSVAHNTGS